MNNYYDNVNPELFSAIPIGIKKVIELGCGSGALGAKYKTISPSSYWLGIEVVPEQASIAKGRLDNVLCQDVEIDDLEIDDDTFDALIIGDVLEHLKDPWTVLRKLVVKVKSPGYIAICIPNIGHWTIIASLLQGSFDYTNSGILDKTHLRFFTLKSMLKMCDIAGIEVKKVIPRKIVFDQKKFVEFVESSNELYNLLSLDRSQAIQRLSTLQYILIGTKKY